MSHPYHDGLCSYLINFSPQLFKSILDSIPFIAFAFHYQLIKKCMKYFYSADYLLPLSPKFANTVEEILQVILRMDD